MKPPSSTTSHFSELFAVLMNKLLNAETKARVRERKPLGSDASRCVRAQMLDALEDTGSELTFVYHSIIRGNKGRGMVNAIAKPWPR